MHDRFVSCSVIGCCCHSISFILLNVKKNTSVKYELSFENIYDHPLHTEMSQDRLWDILSLNKGEGANHGMGKKCAIRLDHTLFIKMYDVSPLSRYKAKLTLDTNAAILLHLESAQYDKAVVVRFHWLTIGWLHASTCSQPIVSQSQLSIMMFHPIFIPTNNK